MELWVRSQDKEKLIKSENFKYGFGIYGHIILNGEIILGKYETKERALEILDEIQNILKPQKIIKIIDNTVKMENAIHIVNPTYETITQFDTYVYEMPEE